MNLTPEDHDILIRNTALTEETHRRVTEALQQLGRGNERFQAIDARFIAIETRLNQLEVGIPQLEANLRNDMVRAMGSVGDLNKESIENAIKPLQKSFVPIEATVNRIHLLIKWAAAIVSSIATALLIAYLTHLLFP